MKKFLLFFAMIIMMSSPSKAQTDSTWLDLDGTDDFLDFGADNILAGQTQFTVEMRMHFDNSTGDYTLIGQRTSDLNRTIVLQRWSGDFYLFLSNTNYGYCSFIPCESMIYHIAIVFDGAGAANSDRLKLFVNGVMQSLTFTSTIDNTSYVTSPAANLVLGCEHNGPSTQLQFVNGQFGEFCIWNRALTQSEINNRIIPEVAGTETGLVEYFRFNNGTPGGNNTGITSFAGGHGVSTITPTNMTMSGTGSNFVGRPVLSNVIDPTVTVTAPSITSNQSGASYQWLNCNSGYSVISGATSQSYTATAIGNYAVKITEGACVDTSVCTQINSVGVRELVNESLSIFPNPVQDELILENKNRNEELNFEVKNSVGQLITNGILNERTVIQTSEWLPGIYLLKLQGDKSISLKTIVKN